MSAFLKSSLLCLAVTGMLAACASPPPPRAGFAPPGTPDPGCVPTDQDAYVYHPDRLPVVWPCLHVSGTVDKVETEADGDLHIGLRLDPAFAPLMPPGYQAQPAHIIAEGVCYRLPLRADAENLCVTDPDPYAGPLPALGQHVWLEGRYVVDLNHEASPELHPLYGWGALP